MLMRIECSAYLYCIMIGILTCMHEIKQSQPCIKIIIMSMESLIHTSDLATMHCSRWNVADKKHSSHVCSIRTYCYDIASKVITVRGWCLRSTADSNHTSVLTFLFQCRKIKPVHSHYTKSVDHCVLDDTRLSFNMQHSLKNSVQHISEIKAYTFTRITLQFKSLQLLLDQK